MNSKIRKLCVNGMGIALFVCLSMCLRVPVFDNFYLCLGYIVMTVYLYKEGIISGTLVGTLGTFLYCFLINGLRGMPGWVIGNIIIGIILGVWFKYLKKIKNKKMKIVMNFVSIIIVIISVSIGILGIKSVVECLLYSQPFIVRVTTNIPAFISDVFVIVISLPLCKILNPILERSRK